MIHHVHHEVLYPAEIAEVRRQVCRPDAIRRRSVHIDGEDLSHGVMKPFCPPRSLIFVDFVARDDELLHVMEFFDGIVDLP